MITQKLPLQIKSPSNVIFGVANEYLDMNDFIIKMGFPYPEIVDPEKSIELEGYTYPDSKKGDYYVLIHRFTSPGYIAHEIRHMLNYVYMDIDYKIDPGNDELDAYLLGYFVDYLFNLQIKACKKK